MTKFYTFRQVASGGFDIHDENLSKYVIIEARNAEEANRIAENIGIYFDGVAKGIDCECCGDRWYPVDEFDAEEKPMIFGEPATMYKDVIIHYLDRSKVVY